MVQGWGHIVFVVPSVDRAYAILKARGVDRRRSSVATIPLVVNDPLVSTAPWLQKSAAYCGYCRRKWAGAGRYRTNQSDSLNRKSEILALVNNLEKRPVG